MARCPSRYSNMKDAQRQQAAFLDRDGALAEVEELGEPGGFADAGATSKR
jgi:hypothetical protein